MSFTIDKVGYRDFRNMADFSLVPDPRLTILVGPNAAGKTNCVEGIQLLTTGSSFKHAKNTGLIREGAPSGRVALHASSEKRELDLAYDVFPSKKLLTLNGKHRPAAEGKGILPSIVFYPDELLIVKGGAAGRRALFDDLGVQLNKTYARAAEDYRRAVSQRNNLLKSEELPEDLFIAWTESLINAGAALLSFRLALIARLSGRISAAYARLADGEMVDISYLSTFLTETPGEGATETNPLDTLPDRGTIRDRLAAELSRQRAVEVRRGQTMVGPHLDDVLFRISGRDARSFGSQGQQRTLVLAVKLAQVELVREITGQYPVFLLDDVMSELDAGRRSRLFDLVNEGMQTVVTTTNLSYFRIAELDGAKVVDIGAQE